MRHENILGLIGDTPLVGVHALSPNPDVRIFAKLDVRDRAQAVIAAYEHGLVRPNASA